MKIHKNNLLKKLQYRSHYRGCKEMDIVLGNFAKSNLENLTYEELLIYEKFLDIEDPEIWQSLIDENNHLLDDNVFMRKIRNFVRG